MSERFANAVRELMAAAEAAEWKLRMEYRRGCPPPKPDDCESWAEGERLRSALDGMAEASRSEEARA